MNIDAIRKLIDVAHAAGELLNHANDVTPKDRPTFTVETRDINHLATAMVDLKMLIGPITRSNAETIINRITENKEQTK